MSDSRRLPSTNEGSDIATLMRGAVAIFATLALFGVGALIYVFFPDPNAVDAPAEFPPAEFPPGGQAGQLTVFWGSLPEMVSGKLQVTDSEFSNITPADYAGPESCRKCHPQNYANWRQHPHRRMNALASEANVVGDFSGAASIHFRDWTATFYREDQGYRMRCERDGEVRTYQINQTIGSRFFQYYVGKGITGSVAPEHDYYHKDHVLPFGYWIDREAWVPIVHVHSESADDQRWDPLKTLKISATSDESRVGEAPGIARGTGSAAGQELGLQYASSCNYCHTTFPLGDLLARAPAILGPNLPNRLLFSLKDYVSHSHPELLDETAESEEAQFQRVSARMEVFTAPQKAATLGVSCEACHLGSKAHAEEKLKKPGFAAHGGTLYTNIPSSLIERGRTHTNLNWVCSRCHTGNRPTYAGNMSTWNSTEFTDASKGACYSELNCVHCHEPHTATGKKWTRSPQQDDESCLSCHKKFAEPAFRQSHTHHATGSAGDHCMNCHMPKINEGMQDVVRTHTIFSPTRADMLEANHPNACNLCHLDKPIYWTLKHLESWYGQEYSANRVAANYPDRRQPVGLGWLKHEYESVRLVAAAALTQSKSEWALPHLIDSLDDDYLMNRQFTQAGLEDMLQIKLDEQFGYWFYQTKEQRREPIKRLRNQYVPP